MINERINTLTAVVEDMEELVDQLYNQVDNVEVMLKRFKRLLKEAIDRQAEEDGWTGGTDGGKGSSPRPASFL